MEPALAHRIASQNHEGQRNRFGDPVIDHLARVAAAVPADAQATALLHDLLELCPAASRRLREPATTGPGPHMHEPLPAGNVVIVCGTTRST